MSTHGDISFSDTLLTMIHKTRLSTLFWDTFPCPTSPSKFLKQARLSRSIPFCHLQPPSHSYRCFTFSLAFKTLTGSLATTQKGRVLASTSFSPFCRPVPVSPPLHRPADACLQYPCDEELQWCIKSWYVTLDDGAVASDAVIVHPGAHQPRCSSATPPRAPSFPTRRRQHLWQHDPRRP